MAGILMTDPGFGRGHTLLETVATIDPAQGESVTGTQKTFTDTDPRTTHASLHYSNRPVTCIAVRNNSGGPLLPGTVVSFEAENILTAVDAASADGSGLTGVVDEYLPSDGVRDGDVFWVVVSGPTAITTAATVAAGDALDVSAGAAIAGAGDTYGYAISPDADGKVRTLVGAVSEHSAS